MPQRGDIVVERLTGRRAIVIQFAGPEEVTCRFADGRLEERYTFELEAAFSLPAWLAAILVAPFVSHSREPAPLGGRVRPLVLRQPGQA